MITIVGLAGSLRKGSVNKMLLRAAVERAPAGTSIEPAGIEGIPLYDGDLEAADGVPEAVERLKDRIAAADGLLMCSPEYNNSLPGPFKNAIDWLTRPPKDIARVFGDIPVGLMGATPGRGGTRFGQTAWLPVFRTLGMRPFFGKTLYVASAGDVFDDSGTMVDDELGELLSAYLEGFAAFVADNRRRR